MFDNIIGYDKLVSHLSQLVIKREVPSVILLSGQKYSGKQTIACELARTILCETNGDWGCECIQCKHSRMFTHQNVLLMGRGELMNEITCGRDLVLANNESRSVNFLIRAVSKLLRRADFTLWESTDVWRRSLKSPCEILREQLLDYQENEEYWFKETKLKTLYNSATKLYDAFPSQMFSVRLIRNVIAWSMVRTSGQAKIIVINRIEDMLSSSANMLLKTLEEPPEQVYFILLSNNSFSVMQTIKSRAREFVLPERSLDFQKEVLTRVFRYNQEDTLEYPTIEQYLNNFVEYSSILNGAQDMGVATYAHNYYQSILQQKTYEDSLLGFVGTQNKQARKLGLIFLNYLTISVKELLKDETLMAYFVCTMWRECDEAKRSIEQKNISTVLVLESLYYTLVEHYDKSIG